MVIVAVPEVLPEQLLTDIRSILGTKKMEPIPVSRENIVAAIRHFYGSKPGSRTK